MSEPRGPVDTYPLKRLDEVAEFMNALRRDIAPAERRPGPYPYFAGRGRSASVDRYLFDEPLLLLAERAAPIASSDEPVVQCVRGKAWVGKGMHVLRPSAQIDLDYLYHVVCGQMLGVVTGSSARQRIGRARIAALLVPVPALDEQRRIAALLDQADSLRVMRRRAQAQLEPLLRMLFLERFGDPVDNPRRWPSLPFGRLGENQDAQRVPSPHSSRKPAVESGFPCYRQDGIVDWVEDAVFDGVRLIVGETGVNLVDRSQPVARVVGGRFSVDRHVHVVAANGLAELRYLQYALELVELKPYLGGGAKPRLTRGSLERISLPVPPLTLQREFCGVVEEVERLRSKQSESSMRLDGLCTVLRQNAVRGVLQLN